MAAQHGRGSTTTHTVMESSSRSHSPNIAAGVAVVGLGHKSSQETRAGSYLKRACWEMTHQRAILPLRGPWEGMDLRAGGRGGGGWSRWGSGRWAGRLALVQKRLHIA